MLSFQGFPTFDVVQNNDGLFRVWYFEPMIAVISFFIWIHIWWRAERVQGLSRINHIADAAINPIGYSILSVVAYSIGIYIWKLFVPPVAEYIPDGIPNTNTTTTSFFFDSWYLILEVSSGIVAYDFIFFFIHWAMHEIPFLRRLHHYHHAMPFGVVEARDVLHHSFPDASLQVLVNILVQRSTPWGTVKSRMARILHNIIVTSMLTESHSASRTPYFWRRWFVGIREHRLHHLHDNRHRQYSNNNSQPLGQSVSSSSSSSSSSSLHSLQGRKFDRHQQFFGYLDDFRFFCLNTQWRLKVASPINNKAS